MQKAMYLLKPILVIAIYVLLFIMLYMLRKYVFRPLNTKKAFMDQYAQGELQTMELEPVGEGELRSLSPPF